MDATILGKSIIVPSVKELTKGCQLETVPDRYIHFDQDTPISTITQNTDNNELQVPIIDMEGLIAGDGAELKKLHLACLDWGFFQLINHGVSLSLMEKFKLGIEDLFNLPIDEKKKYWQRPNEIEGFGQAFVLSEEQKLDWADMFFLTVFPKHERRPHLFPLLPSPLRDTMEKYSDETRKLGIQILEFMAKNLGIDSFRDVFGEGQQMMRMNYYPSCPQPEKVIGLKAHSDAVALTILLQLNDMDGLQILKHGKWITVKPLRHAFVVNVGDILEILSNGVYKSINHRAVANASKERLSVGAFYSPSLSKEIGAIDKLITPKTPAKFTRITMVDYWKEFFTRPLDGKSYLNTMRTHECDERSD